MLRNKERSINAAVLSRCYNFRMWSTLCVTSASEAGVALTLEKRFLIRSALYYKNRIDKFRKEFSSLSFKKWVEIILQDDHSVKEMPSENILKMPFWPIWVWKFSVCGWTTSTRASDIHQFTYKCLYRLRLISKFSFLLKRSLWKQTFHVPSSEVILVFITKTHVKLFTSFPEQMVSYFHLSVLIRHFLNLWLLMAQ